MLDEMAIKTQIEWDGKQHVGFVNLGTNIDDDYLPAATNALVFLLVPINSNWKIPVAYYLTNGLTGKVLANLTRNILAHLVCDGCGGNQSMLSELGVPTQFIIFPTSSRPIQKCLRFP